MIKGYANLKETKEYFKNRGIHKNYIKNTEKFYSLLFGMGTHLGEFTDEHSNLYIDTLTYGLENGVNFIDTSVNYREMKSEKDVGVVLNKLINKRKTIKRGEIVIATKGGQIYGDCEIDVKAIDYLEEILIPEGILNIEDVNIVDGHMHTLAPYFYETTIELSKRNLGIDTIDIHYIHNPEISMYVLGEVEFYKQLKVLVEFYEEQVEKGNIQFYGMSTWKAFICDENSPWYISLEKVLDIAREVKGLNNNFKFIQMPYNIYNKSALENKTQLVGKEHYCAIRAAKKLGLYTTISSPLNQCRDNDSLSINDKLEFIIDTKDLQATIIGSKTKKHLIENLNYILSERLIL
ncbi:MAG: aldo/keto reductase [Peptostreptococcaceae bacterium]